MKIINKFKRLLFTIIIRMIYVNNKSIISANCLGNRVYKCARRAYNTPTVGLWFEPEDFYKFVTNLTYYLDQELKEVSSPLDYPLTMLGDIRIHMMHYSSFSEAKSKWDRRVSRININNILIVNTDRDGANHSTIKKLHDDCSHPIITFSSSNLEVSSGRLVVLNKYKNQGSVGDLFTNYDELLFVFPYRYLL